MTETHRWLATRRRELLLRHALGAVLGTAGCLLALFSLGVMLSRLGVYRHVPDLVLAVWLGAATHSRWQHGIEEHWSGLPPISRSAIRPMLQSKTSTPWRSLAAATAT